MCKIILYVNIHLCFFQFDRKEELLSHGFVEVFSIVSPVNVHLEI